MVMQRQPFKGKERVRKLYDNQIGRYEQSPY